MRAVSRAHREAKRVAGEAVHAERSEVPRRIARVDRQARGDAGDVIEPRFVDDPGREARVKQHVGVEIQRRHPPHGRAEALRVARGAREEILGVEVEIVFVEELPVQIDEHLVPRVSKAALALGRLKKDGIEARAHQRVMRRAHVTPPHEEVDVANRPIGRIVVGHPPQQHALEGHHIDRSAVQRVEGVAKHPLGRRVMSDPSDLFTSVHRGSKVPSADVTERLNPRGPDDAVWSLSPIGVARTVFRKKYSIPRQPGLCPSARGTLVFRPDPDLVGALRGIEGFSHLWVVYVFHATGTKGWKPGIRAPRLGGAQKVGVLASRSPHRPNPIGLSVVELLAAHLDHPEGPRLEVRGVDLLDGSPILDVKPYLPYADSVPRARAGWAQEPVRRYKVRFSAGASRQARALEARLPDLRAMVRELLSLDPRPAHQQTKLPIAAPHAVGTRWGFTVLDHEVRWEITSTGALVTAILPPREGVEIDD